MSSKERKALADAIGRAVMRWQDAVQAFDEAVGSIYKLNGAERRCLAFVSQGAQTASAIAEETALTPAAVTSLIDRLEARGFVRRRRDTRDRRRIHVEATDTTKQLARDAYGPIARAGERMLGRYSVQELESVRRFLEDALALQQRMTADLVRQSPGEADAR
jgi:DNA-binding MarR family transcriptional regulator